MYIVQIVLLIIITKPTLLALSLSLIKFTKRSTFRNVLKSSRLSSFNSSANTSICFVLSKKDLTLIRAAKIRIFLLRTKEETVCLVNFCSSNVQFGFKYLNFFAKNFSITISATEIGFFLFSEFWKNKWKLFNSI